MCIFWTLATRQRRRITQFFCSNATGSLTVTITMSALPPGRYAVYWLMRRRVAGWTDGLVLAWDGAATQWKLAGLPCGGVFDGHDGVWYWMRARELARTDPKSDSWSAWFSYDAARYLLLPLTLSFRQICKSCARNIGDIAVA